MLNLTQDTHQEWLAFPEIHGLNAEIEIDFDVVLDTVSEGLGTPDFPPNASGS
jgi:hypothetical protein